MRFLDASPDERLDSLREGATLSLYGFLRYETGVGPRANDPKFDQNSQKSVKKVMKISIGILCAMSDPKSTKNVPNPAPFLTKN